MQPDQSKIALPNAFAPDRIFYSNASCKRASLCIQGILLSFLKSKCHKGIIIVVESSNTNSQKRNSNSAQLHSWSVWLLCSHTYESDDFPTKCMQIPKGIGLKKMNKILSIMQSCASVIRLDTPKELLQAEKHATMELMIFVSQVLV